MINNSGFSLIELVLVMAISTMLLGAGVANYRGFAQRQELANAKGQLLSDLRQLQQDAIAGRKPSGCTGELVRFEFRITRLNTPPRYELRYECTGSNNQRLITKELNEDIVLSRTRNSVYFLPLTGETGQSNTISLAYNGQTVSLVINANGQINP